MADIVLEVVCRVKHVARSGIIYLQSSEFTRDILLDPQQVRRAGFNADTVRKGGTFKIDVRIENDGRLKTSRILVCAGKTARPPGPVNK